MTPNLGQMVLDKLTPEKSLQVILQGITQIEYCGPTISTARGQLLQYG